MRKLLVSLFFILAAAALQAPSASALSLGFSENPFAVTNGGSYSIDVILSGLASDGFVSAFDFDVLYDSSLLLATTADFNLLLGDAAYFEVFQAFDTSNPGVFDFAAVSLLSDAALQALQLPNGGAITLATLNFTGINNGVATLGFDWYVGQDIKGANGEVIYGYVPEPGTMLLIGSGLAAMIGLHRRRAS